MAADDRGSDMIPRYLRNALAQYYNEVQAALRMLTNRTSSIPSASLFEPNFEMPALSKRLHDYFEGSDIAWRPANMGLGAQGDAFLDLTLNGRTRTTKTFASRVIVARALRHIETSGDPVMLISPSSGNKATALRESVAQAYESGLADPDCLRVTCVVPEVSRFKVAAGSAELLDGCNPLLYLRADSPLDVKALVRAAQQVLEKPSSRWRLWFTLAPYNYLAGDVVRAFAERDLGGPAPAQRVHVHAVSSGYGLLGYSLGRELLSAKNRVSMLLVQHPATPDLVLMAQARLGAGEVAPSYSGSAVGGFAQDGNPRFPPIVVDLQEVVDETFYTRNPATLVDMSELLEAHGGDGIVVSAAECRAAFDSYVSACHDSRLATPETFTDLAERSLLMAYTGLRMARARNLVPPIPAVIHGTGAYGVQDFERPDGARWGKISSVDQFVTAVSEACA
jgi:hypothetical protein